MNQAKVGAVPPLIPVAVKVTPTPEQTLVAELETVTLAVGIGDTVRFTTLEAAVALDKQLGKEPPTVNLAKTASPF